MGRCYDFGISIDPSSEQAMIVAQEGGYCVSPPTGTTCEGRFEGCAEIMSSPSRVPPSAPGWSLPTIVAPVGSADDTATDDATTSELPPPTEQIEAESGEQTTAKCACQQAVGELSHQLANHAAETRSTALTQESSLNDLTAIVGSLSQEVNTVANNAVANATVANATVANATVANNKAPASIDDLVEEMVILREDLAPSPIPAELLGLVKQTVDELHELRGAMETIGRAMLQLKGAQEQTTYTVTTLKDRVKGPLAELERRFQTDLTGPDIAGHFNELHAEIGRTRPEPADIVTASQLAATINTLRDAGVDDISSAHLIHSLQLEMRTLRDEVHSIRGDIADFATSAVN